jgi:two-component system KDP operon response regulator KdpE
MSATRVLVVADEPKIHTFLAPALTACGYEVQIAKTSRDALKRIATTPFNVVFLDFDLPNMDGAEVLRKIRTYSKIPIIVLSARTQEAEKVRALDAGADDYLEKPCGINELMARLRVMLRHTARERRDPAQISSGGLRVNFAKRSVTKNGVAIKLTPKEYDFLVMLARHAGHPLTHRQILSAVKGPDHRDNTQYLRVFIGQLRAKIEEDPSTPRLILTEFGVGYRFADLDS